MSILPCPSQSGWALRMCWLKWFLDLHIFLQDGQKYPITSSRTWRSSKCRFIFTRDIFFPQMQHNNPEPTSAVLALTYSRISSLLETTNRLSVTGPAERISISSHSYALFETYYFFLQSGLQISTAISSYSPNHIKCSRPLCSLPGLQDQKPTSHYYFTFWNSTVLVEIIVGSTSSELQHPWITTEPKKIAKK